MLDSIRSGAQSLGVKIAFGVIILVFVFWGVGNFNDRDYSNVVAVVNGEPIVAFEFEKAYHNAEEYLLRNNPGLTREQLIKDHLGRQVLNDLIRQTLLAQEARAAGIEVAPREMRAAVAALKPFQDEAGKFDPDAYQRVLASQRMTPAEYEKDLASQLLQDKMVGLVTATAWFDPDEPLNRFNFLRERRVIDYIFKPASDFAGKVQISDAELEKWYDAHKSRFAIPAAVNVEYIRIEPALLADPASITEESVRAFYEANKSRYDRPERVHARHILVPLAQDADDAALSAATARINKIREELLKGKPFAQAADEVNEPDAADKGGDLGWLGHGQTVPEFDEAVFALEPGAISEPVRTMFGLHLILVEEKQAAGPAPFESVAAEVRKELAFEAGSEKVHDVLDNLIEDNILQKPLAESAARYKLKSAGTGFLDRQGLMQKLGVKAEAADALLAVPAGSPLDTILEAGDDYLVARVVEARPESIEPFSEARSKVLQELTAERSLELAMQDAATVLAKIKSESLDQIRASSIGLTESGPLERGGILPGFAPDEALMSDIFATKPGAWLAAPLAVKKGDQPGSLLAYVDKVVAPGENEYETVAEILTRATRQDRLDGLYALFIQNLAKNAKVEITNQNLIDRVNM